MFRLLTILLLLVSVPVFSSPAAEKGPVWEIVTLSDSPQTGSDSENLQVETREGYIYITLDRPAQVEVFTILGQLVTRRKLQAGITRLQLSHRGVYILKCGAVTRRVNL